MATSGAFEIPSFMLGVFEANVALSAFVGVVLVAASGAGVQGDHALGLPAAGAAIVGICQNAPQVAEAGAVMVAGVSRGVVGATAVVAGDILAVDANGNFVPAVTGNFGVGMALQSGATGVVIAILLGNYGKQ